MDEENRPVYCPRCGSIAQAGDKFCGVCGERITPDAQDAVPTQDIPPVVQPPPQVVPARRRNRTLSLLAGFGALAAVVLAIGAIVALNLLGGKLGSQQGQVGPAPAATTQQEKAPGPAHSAQEETTVNLSNDTSPPPDSTGPNYETIASEQCSFYGHVLWCFYVRTEARSREDLTKITLDIAHDKNSGGDTSDVIRVSFQDPSTGDLFAVADWFRTEQTARTILYAELPDDQNAADALVQEAMANNGVFVYEDSGSTSEDSTYSSSPDKAESDDLEAEAEEAAGDYYRAAGLEDWDYTYEHLDSETQSAFSREEWFKKNQWLADNGTVIYYILSVDLESTTQEPNAEVTLRLTYEDGSSSIRKTLFVLEDGEWKHHLTEEEKEIFMPDASYEEFVHAQEEGS
jgi:hypothetical protein